MPTTNPLSVAWATSPVGRVAAPLREQVIAALTEAILDFRLAPGQRLIERELIEQLGVSRTTVREALRELASDGLVTVLPQKGAIVSAPSADEARDLYDVRARLESLIVERFVERATDEQVERLAAAVEEFARIASTTADIKTVLVTKDRFYEVLLEGASSSALQQMIETIQARVRLLRATSLSEAGRSAEAAEELRGVVAAIRVRDSATASARTAEHVRNASVTALHSLPA